MGLFRKKPVTIEAVRVAKHMGLEPQWFADAVTRGDVVTHGLGKFADALVRVRVEINTLEGVMTANEGDWLIKGIQGELYPCKPDIFAATYEPA